MSMIERPEGGFDFVPGSGTYCNDAVARPGFAIAHAVFVRALPLARAFEAARAYLEGLGRPMAALCGAEVRIAEPLSFDGFGAFNATYIALLDAFGLRVTVDGARQGAATRTNVAPAPHAARPAEPSLYGFSFTVPGQRPGGRKTFVSAGAGELPGGTRESIIRRGETTPDAMREKARWVMGSVVGRLPRLGVGVEDITHTNVYCVHSADGYWESEVLPPLGAQAAHGARWFHARPPILEVEFEVDLKGVLHEVWL